MSGHSEDAPGVDKGPTLPAPNQRPMPVISGAVQPAAEAANHNARFKNVARGAGNERGGRGVGVLAVR